MVLSNPALLALIVEFNGLGARYGFDDHATHLMLCEHGFVPVRYAPFKRQLTEATGPNTTGTLYMRPSAELDDRLRSAEPIDVHGIVF